MTEKRRVYLQLTKTPKTPAAIGKTVGLTATRTAKILQQLVKEGKAVHKPKGYVLGTGVPPKPPPTPPPPIPPKPKPSWTLPGPLIMTASDPGSANGYPGVGTIGRIVVSGVCPLWRCDPVSGSGVGWLGQIEGQAQLDIALGMLNSKPAGDSKAIVGTGGVNADRMIAAGINVAFAELNAQSGWEPYGNAARICFQLHQDGFPYVYPSYGCYDGIGLQDYAAYVPDVWSTDTNGMVPGTEPQGLADYYACFSAEGMTDTDSWPAIV